LDCSGWFELGQPSLGQEKLVFSIFIPSSKKNLLGLGQKIPVSEPGHPLIYCGSEVMPSKCWKAIKHLYFSCWWGALKIAGTVNLWCVNLVTKWPVMISPVLLPDFDSIILCLLIIESVLFFQVICATINHDWSGHHVRW